MGSCYPDLIGESSPCWPFSVCSFHSARGPRQAGLALPSCCKCPRSCRFSSPNAIGLPLSQVSCSSPRRVLKSSCATAPLALIALSSLSLAFFLPPPPLFPFPPKVPHLWPWHFFNPAGQPLNP